VGNAFWLALSIRGSELPIRAEDFAGRVLTEPIPEGTPSESREEIHCWRCRLPHKTASFSTKD
jgi:hypothetical protein